METRHILIIDDEPDIVKVLKIRLQKQGYDVSTAGTGQAGVQTAGIKNPDLILLDLMLPDMDGFDVCKKIRQDKNTQHIPIIMLTARSSNMDQVVGLELGADDYVTKPFDFTVLHSRIKNLFRRSTKQNSTPPLGNNNPVLRAGKLEVDPVRFKAFVNDKEVILTTTEFRILYFLMKNQGRMFSRDDVLNGAWKEPVAINDRAVDVHINGIRTKLKEAGEYIETIRGEGYRFREFAVKTS